jgi:DNA-binding XRE family transcriptional regulator
MSKEEFRLPKDDRGNRKLDKEKVVNFIEKNKQKPTRVIADMIGCGIASVNRIIKEYGIQKKFSRITISFDVDDNGCFMCTASKGSHGYPQYKGYPVHRHVYEECFGEIPKGLVVRHKCDNKLCINPYHLKLGTRSDNFLDIRRTDRWTGHENHWNSKLKEEDVKFIRDNANGKSQKEMARMFGVSVSTIGDVVHYRTWPIIEGVKETT